MKTWDIPYERNPAFIGHEDTLSALHNAFQRGGLQALTGPDGIGKTQIALEYAYRYRTEYQQVFWVTASLCFLDSATICNLAEQLQRTVASKPWLLVLDQFEDQTLIEQFLPEGSTGHVLLTTRMHIPRSVGNSISVASLSSEDAILFFLRRLGTIGPGASLDQTSTTMLHIASSITALLQDNPFALEVAAGYVKSTHVNLWDYLRQLYRKIEGIAMLESISRNDLQCGQQVVYFDGASISIGCIKEVKQYDWQEEDDGTILLAEVMLAEADNQEQMAQLFYRTYLHQKALVPTAEQFYRWPATLPTFQTSPAGPEKQIRLKLDIRIIIVSSGDFDAGENTSA